MTIFRLPFRALSVVSAVLLVGIACGNGPTTPAQTGPGVDKSSVLIGSHLPLTGPASLVGQGFQSGVDMAFIEINNAGGVNGRKLKAVYVDTKGTADAGITAARELVEKDKVFAILSGGTSTETLPALPYLRQSNVPYIALASAPDLVQPISPNIFIGTSTLEDVKAAYAAKWIGKNLKPKSVAVGLCNTSHCAIGGPVLEQGLKDQGIQIATETTHTVADTDFTAQIAKMMAAKPDLMYVYSLAASGARFVAQLRAKGWTGPIASDSGVATSTVIDLAKSGTDNFYSNWFVSSALTSDSSGPMVDFLKAFKAAYPNAPAGLPNIYTYMGYQDAYVVAEGLRRAGNNVTWTGFEKALETLDKFVAGKDPYWKKAYAIGSPRTFTSKVHAGSTYVRTVIVKDRDFVFAPD
jgi:branched-chain amino acid transport system substrate-binding protein